MGTSAQIDVRRGNKVVHIYTQFDGYPKNVLPVLDAAAKAGYRRLLDIANEIVRQWNRLHIIAAEEADPSDVSYHYVVDVTSTTWRVEEATMPTICIRLVENPANHPVALR